MRFLGLVFFVLLIGVSGCTSDGIIGVEETLDQNSAETQLCCSTVPVLVSPEQEGFVIGDAIPVEVTNCTRKDLNLSIDGRQVTPIWKTLPYDNRCTAWISSPGTGKRSITVSGSWGSTAHSFEQVPWYDLPRVVNPVIDQFILDNAAGTLNWDWGPSVFLYALERYYRATGVSDYLEYLQTYHASWIGRYPEIRQPDQCPPALSALALFLDHGTSVGMDGARRAIDYIRNTPLTETGALNHLGTGLQSYIYPKSIWIDSMMMYVLLSVVWGDRMEDADLFNFGLDQALIFRKYLQDPSTGLFHHAYIIRTQGHFPGDGWFWLRGDGWGAAALVDILDFVPETDPRRAILEDTFRIYMAALRKHQLHNGLWDTILNDPGYAYMESSGSALVAYAMAKGFHRGLLTDDKYLEASQKTFGTLVGRLKKRSIGYALPGISGPTDAGPKWWYKLMPTGENRDYGLGAFLLLAHELYEN